MFKVCVLVAVACLSLGVRSAAASTVAFRTDAQLVAQAERVVHGRVVSQRTVRGLVGASIYTVTTLQVIEDLSGIDSTTVEVWELGGTVDGETMYVGGGVEFSVSEEVVVLLERGPQGLHTVGMGLSKFMVGPAVNGDRQLRRNLRETMLVNGVVAADPSLAQLRALAVSRTGREPKAGRAPLADERDRSVQAPYTFLGPNRWVQADSGQPVTWYMNNRASSPLISSNGVPELQTALSAWTAPAAASIILQYGGMTNQADADGPFTGLTGAVGVLTFEDPNNVLNFPTLAIGGGFSSGAGGTIRGTTFTAFTRAYVIFDNVSSLPSAYRQSLDFTRVLTHEIGHTIGMGHTQTNGAVANPQANIMYPTCCATAMPVPPALGPDDLAGLTFIYPVPASCTYAVSPTSASAPATGSGGTITVTTQAGCTWTATSNSPSVVNLSGTTSGSVNYAVSANGTNFRTGTLTVAGQAFTVYQFGTGPLASLTRTALRYGATLQGGTVVAQTTAQTLRFEQTSGASVGWTASSNQPWLNVSPTSGVGSTTLTVSVNPAIVNAPARVEGTIAFALNGAGNITPPVNVALATMVSGTSAGPTGVIDTPLDNITGVVGAIPVTGWALDDVDVTNVFVCRLPTAGETVAPDGRCGGAAHSYVGDALFIEDARSDIAAAFSGYPRNYRGGWGLMLLTNMLPGQGNGNYTLIAYARDREGAVAPIGQRTFTADNAHATKPFGAIDTPEPGGTATGNNFVNFGWALTPSPKFIPTDGSTITVYVDGVAVGHPTYGNYRADIASLFPGLNNSQGAIGFKLLDTTSLSVGLHTISWTVADNLGATEGIGSRYFRVARAGPLTAAPPRGRTSAIASSVSAASPVTGAIYGRLGWDRTRPWHAFPATSAGRVIVRAEEVGRIELRLGGNGAGLEGFLRIGDLLEPLPVGARLDSERATFTWQPGLGFVGSYDFVFVHGGGSAVVTRQDVRIILQPKRSGYVGPQISIDTPTPHAGVTQPFLLAGWAAELGADAGTGVSTVHAWAYPLTGSAPIFLGAATYGVARPDVAAVHGEQFTAAGFNLPVQGLAPGAYDVAVFAWVEALGTFAPAHVVRVTIR